MSKILPTEFILYANDAYDMLDNQHACESIRSVAVAFFFGKFDPVSIDSIQVWKRNSPPKSNVIFLYISLDCAILDFFLYMIGPHRRRNFIN